METMKPILFSTPMVRAILAGNKTQTRRVIKPQPVLDGDRLIYDRRIKGRKVYVEVPDKFVEVAPTFAPYQVGDTLWVRETWREKISTVCDVCAIRNPTRACKSKCAEYLYRADTDCKLQLKWKPSIYMPLAAARIFLRVTGVRVERLCSITEADAEKEGCPKTFNPANGKLVARAREEFQDVWNKINGKRGYGWMTNPLVFVYQFEVMEVKKWLNK